MRFSVPYPLFAHRAACGLRSLVKDPNCEQFPGAVDGLFGFLLQFGTVTLMGVGDIYVLVTATFDRSCHTKSVVVLVPRKAIEEYRPRIQAIKEKEEFVARELADPVASYVFTHRPDFGSFRVAHSFSAVPPPEIEHEAPEFTRGEVKAWVLG